MTNSIFTSKEHYLSFRAAWAESVNIAQPNRNKIPYDGCIAPEQHMLYNILRGKHPECGFTSITNPNKLHNGMYENHASFYASMRLMGHINAAKEAIDESKNFPHWIKARMESFLSAFKGTVTAEMLASLTLEKIQPIYLVEQEAA